MIIVDSPGIGESEIMDNIVVNYLPNAFAFIYVINSGMAGGVQKDRVRVFYKPLKHIFAFLLNKVLGSGNLEGISIPRIWVKGKTTLKRFVRPLKLCR